MLQTTKETQKLTKIQYVCQGGQLGLRPRSPLFCMKSAGARNRGRWSLQYQCRSEQAHFTSTLRDMILAEIKKKHYNCVSWSLEISFLPRVPNYASLNAVELTGDMQNHKQWDFEILQTMRGWLAAWVKYPEFVTRYIFFCGDNGFQYFSGFCWGFLWVCTKTVGNWKQLGCFLLLQTTHIIKLALWIRSTWNSLQVFPFFFWYGKRPCMSISKSNWHLKRKKEEMWNFWMEMLSFCHWRTLLCRW